MTPEPEMSLATLYADYRAKADRDAEVTEIQHFLAVVGLGISEWSWMEEELVRIIARLLRVSEAKAGLVAYSNISLHVWLSLIDDLFAHDGTYPRSLAEWTSIRKRLLAENDVRVKLAHHAIASSE